MKKFLVVLAVSVFACFSSLALANEASAPLALNKGKLGVGLSVGYGSADKVFDTEGESVDLGGTYSTLPITIGAGYGIIDGLEGDITLSVVRNAFSPDEGESVSGFGLRSVNIGVKYAIIPELAVSAGFLLDTGEKPEKVPEDELEISDGSHAIALGVLAKKAFDKVVVRGGLNYTLIFARDMEDTNLEINMGDYLDLTVGAGYQILDNLFVGLSIMYALQLTDDEIEGEPAVPDPSLEAAKYSLLSLGLKAVYDVNDKISVFLSLAEQDEYFKIGIPLTGKSSWFRFAPAAGIPPVTIGVKATLL